MDAVCTREVLQQGVAAVQNVVGSKISNPVVENILLTLDKSGLAFTATNLTLSVEYRGQAQVKKGGKLAVPAKVLGGVSSDLFADDVVFSTQGKTLVITNGRAQFQIHGLEAEEFPPFLPVVEGSRVVLPIGRLKHMVARTAFATSPEKSRYELDGVKIDSIDGGLRFVATDGRRLAQSDLLEEGLDVEIGVLVPSRTMREVQRILPDEGMVDITVAQGKIMFECGPIRLVSSLLQNLFPPYNQIVPKSTPSVVTVDREQFLHAVRGVSVISGDRAGLIRLEISPSEMIVKAEQTQIGQAEVAINCEYNAEAIVIGYQSQFLIDVLRILDGETISLGLSDPRSPGVIRQVGDDSFLYVLMPVRLAQYEPSEDYGSSTGDSGDDEDDEQ